MFLPRKGNRPERNATACISRGKSSGERVLAVPHCQRNCDFGYFDFHNLRILTKFIFSADTMAFSAEKKRELRKKKREAEQAKKEEQGAKMLQLAPPFKLLKAPYKKQHLGNVNVDYGGHQKALNFPQMQEGGQQVHLALDAQQLLEEDGPCQLVSAAPKLSENRMGSPPRPMSIGRA
jgi:hypothetical protein